MNGYQHSLMIQILLLPILSVNGLSQSERFCSRSQEVVGDGSPDAVSIGTKIQTCS